jgi:prevent-host-death family protein
MTTVNMHEAKSQLSKLVAAIRSGSQSEVVIAINGAPAARLVPIDDKPKLRWGLLKGKITIPDNIDGQQAEIDEMFAGCGD